ncbi:ImmA/IrrE family metallo-endopeptidase [Amycolatopsis umgeniensis]|uniref:Zn-dependent peptidase ImmA (M78 family) n=1 Tax=Amycolatopsis umgeniensis TaxID=336628 RepID=A0A841BAX9_9PSEU|nr:Zn-dependent peptidase ImmA (M78 family) [Amycolatopsis umgeniensis]
MTLRRGFKAEAEREAARVRKELGLASHDRLDPRDLAKHLSVSIVDSGELVDVTELEDLERLQAFAFSAATFEIEQRKIIVVSPLRNTGRQNSDIAHELAHVMLKHDLSEIREVDGMPFRTCKPDEEEEATAFGGTLLLPRPLLLSAARRQASIEQIANQYDVTVEMARFRYNTTGVAKQAMSR